MKDYDVIMQNELKHNQAFLIALLPLTVFILSEHCFLTRSVFDPFVGLVFKGLNRFC